MNTEAPARISRKWLRLTLIEWLIVGVIVVILAALLLPPPKWGASGLIDVPIRVVVFNATQGQPIKDARVAVLKSSLDLQNGVFPEVSPADFESLKESAEHLTNAQGMATIHQRFMTEANYKSPEPFVILFNQWVVVSAEGFAPVITTLRYDTERTEKLRKRGGLVIAIGLVRESE